MHYLNVHQMEQNALINYYVLNIILKYCVIMQQVLKEPVFGVNKNVDNLNVKISKMEQILKYVLKLRIVYQMEHNAQKRKDVLNIKVKFLVILLVQMDYVFGQNNMDNVNLWMDVMQLIMIKQHVNKQVIVVYGFKELMEKIINVLNIHVKHMKIILVNVNIF